MKLEKPTEDALTTMKRFIKVAVMEAILDAEYIIKAIVKSAVSEALIEREEKKNEGSNGDNQL